MTDAKRGYATGGKNFKGEVFENAGSYILASVGEHHWCFDKRVEVWARR